MDRIYLIIFLVLIGAFIYWYQKNVLKFKYNKSTKRKRAHSKSRKLKKKSKSRKSKKTKKSKNNDTENSEGLVDTDSTDSKIRRKKNNLKKAYHKHHSDTPSLDSLSMGGNSRGTQDSEGDYSLDSASSSDFLSQK